MISNDEVTRRITGENRGGDKTCRPCSRDIFHRMNGKIYSLMLKGIVKSPDKYSLSADLMKGNTGLLVTGGRDEHQLSLLSLIM